MADETAGTLKARYAELDGRLDAGLSEGERPAVKADIVALFRTIEAQVTELTALKEDVRKLVDKWKSQQAAAAPSVAPQFTAEKPMVQADHIGASTFIEKGWSRLSLGDFEGAEASLQRAIELSPNDPTSESLLGWAQMLQEKFDAALANFQKVLMREPANSLARVNVGYICLKKRTFSDAIEHLSKAIRLDNDKKATLYAHFYLGLVYLEREMYEEAETFLQKTLVLGPNLIEAWYELGWAYWLNEQRDEGVAAWKSGFAANKFNPWGKRCAETLKAAEAGGEPIRG